MFARHAFSFTYSSGNHKYTKKLFVIAYYMLGRTSKTFVNLNGSPLSIHV